MSVFSKIRSWFKRAFSGGSSSSSRSRASRVSNYGGGGSRSYRDYSSGGYRSDYEDRQAAEKRRRQEQLKKRQATTNALASISKRTDALSSGRSSSVASSATSTGNGTAKVLAKIEQKATPPDAKLKQDAAKASRERATKMLKKIESDRKSYNKATGHKYDTEHGTKEERARARQRIKAGEYQSDPNAEKWEVKHHPIAASASRGALSGTTLGASELIAQKSKKRQETGAEQYYQANKNKWAEMGGEAVGSLATFGATAGLTERAGAKIASKVAPNAAERLAERKLIQKAAQKSVDKAVEKGLIKEGSEELVKRVGKEKATKIVNALGNDIVQNLTTGAAYDINKASAEYEIGSSEWWKELGKSAAFNAVITGGVAGGSMLTGNKRLAIEAAERIAKESPTEKAVLRGTLKNAKTIKGKAKSLIPDADEAVEQAARETVENTAERNADGVVRNVEPPKAEAPFANDTVEAARPQNLDEAVERAARETVENAEPPRADYASEREALENRVEQMADEPPRDFDPGEEPNRYHSVKEDMPITGSDTMGKAMAKSAYERNTGETIEGGMKTSWHDAWEASKEYHKSHATGNTTRRSKTSVSQLNMMDSEAERELRDRLAEAGELDYNAIRTEEMLDKVSKQFHEDPDRWVKEMIDYNEGSSVLDYKKVPEWQARAHYIMSVIDPSADKASEIAYTEAYKLATAMSSTSGQSLNMRRQFVQLTPMGRRDAIMDEMANILYNSQGFRNNHPNMPTDKYDGIAYIKAFLEDDPEIEQRVQKLVELGSQAKNAEAGVKLGAEDVSSFAKTDDVLPTDDIADDIADEIDKAHIELITALNEHNPKTGYDVLQEIRYLNMLGNFKTHIRNMFGSGFFGPIRQISNAIRAGIEGGIADRAGMEITKHGGISLSAAKEAWAKNPTSEAGKEALAAFNKVKPELLGSMKMDNQLYKGRGKTIPGKILDAVSDFNSHLLSGEDDIFKEKAFRENYIKSYNKYVKEGIPITPKIKRKIEADAMQEAHIATFNEYNDFAKMLADVTRKAGDPNASTTQRWVGRGVNAVMPFTKVPANIMKESMNYSPVGIAKGFANIKTAVKRKDSELLNRAIDELSSGLTGTGIFGLGMLLGKTTDMFTTNAGKDDAAAKFKKAQGVQNYSITFSPPRSDQKYSMSLDWLVPNSATFFAGVELANQMKKGDFDLTDFGGDWAQILSRTVEPVLETSMLSGLYNVLESGRNSSGNDDQQNMATIMLRETAQSYLNSMIPTALGQTSRTFLYDTDKQIAGETDWEYFRNQAKSKMGLGDTNILGDALGADTDAYGNVKGKKEDAGDYAAAFLKNFISPANIQKVDLDDVDRAKIKQYEDAVKNGADPQEMSYLFPKKQYKKQFTTGNLDVKLSNKDLSTYNQAKTTGGAEGARYALESIMFNRYTKDENGKKHSTADAYTPEQKAEIIKQFEGKSIREVEKWVREQPQFKNATEAEQKKVIDGLWSYSKQGKAQSAKRVGEQAVIKAQGGDVNEYNFNNEITEKKRDALQPLIDNGTITYEEAVDFARFAGKTYYYEDDEGGHSQTYYNKGAMMDYLKSKGYSDEKCAALFNAFKASNAKEYGSSSGRRRRGRRRRGYRHYGHGGSSKKATVPTPKTIKASSFKQGEALVSKKTSSSTKATPPTLKRVQAKIDLPTVRKEY